MEWHFAGLMSGDGSEDRVRFPPELPISARVGDIAAAIDAHQVVIVAGATGSGKTTQLPKIALAMGRGRSTAASASRSRGASPRPASPRASRRELGIELGTTSATRSASTTHVAARRT